MQPSAFRFALALAILCAPAVLSAQPPASDSKATSAASPQKLIAFEVSSVRMQKEGRGGPIRFTADGFMADAAPLEYLIRNAYNITRDNSVRGLPPWGATDYYVVVAKVADSDLAVWQAYDAEQRGQVLQSLLADRFKLQTHVETQDQPVYALVVTKDGAKITPSRRKVILAGGDGTPIAGGTFFSSNTGMSAINTTMDEFVAHLSTLNLGKPVVDRTGLTGRYEFKLQFAPMAGDTSPSSAGRDKASDPAQDIFTALQQQLGLKLESIKGRLDIYVIDHVERPSEN